MADSAKQSEPNGTSGKKVRSSRGKGFPIMPLAEAVRITKRAGNQGRDHMREAFASYMGHSTANSGSFVRRLAALKDYGLVSTDGERVRLTDLGYGLALPDDEQSEAEKVRAAFRNAEAFAQMMDLLPQGQPVSLTTIANRAAGSLGVAAASRAAFARSFAESAEFAGVARKAGADHVELGDGDPARPADAHDSSFRAPPPAPGPSGQARPVVAPVWNIPGGQIAFEVRLDHPLPVTAWAQIGEITGAVEKLVRLLAAPDGRAPENG